jgi:hypothetical protein
LFFHTPFLQMKETVMLLWFTKSGSFDVWDLLSWEIFLVCFCSQSVLFQFVITGYRLNLIMVKMCTNFFLMGPFLVFFRFQHVLLWYQQSCNLYSRQICIGALMTFIGAWVTFKLKVPVISLS